VHRCGSRKIFRGSPKQYFPGEIALGLKSFQGGKHAFQSVERSAGGAQKKIHLRFLLFSKDQGSSSFERKMFQKALQGALYPVSRKKACPSEIFERKISVASPGSGKLEKSRRIFLLSKIISLQGGKNSRKGGKPGVHLFSERKIQGGSGKAELHIAFGGARRFQGTLEKTSGKGLTPEENVQGALAGGGSFELQGGEEKASQNTPGKGEVYLGIPAMGKRSFQACLSGKGSPENSRNSRNFPENRGFFQLFQRKLRKKKRELLSGKKISRKKKIRLSLGKRAFQVQLSFRKRKFFLLLAEDSPEEKGKRLGRAQEGYAFLKDKTVFFIHLRSYPKKLVILRGQIQGAPIQGDGVRK